MASGKRLLTRRVSSLSFRISHSCFSPFIGLPTLAELGDQVRRKLFCRQRQRLPLFRHYIIAPEKTCGALYFTRRTNGFSVPPHQSITKSHHEVEFSRRKHVATQG